MCEKLSDSCYRAMSCVLRFWEVEEFVKNQVLELDGALARLDEARVRELRTEGRQLMKVIRGIGYYLCLLTFVYLSHTIWLLSTLELANFIREFKHEQYA